MLVILALALLGHVAMSAQTTTKAQINGVWYILDISGNVAVVSYPAEGAAYSGEIVIPEKVEYDYWGDGSPIQHFTVREIEAQAFASCKNLTVHLPKTITRIVPSAFSGCTNVTIDAADIASWCGIMFSAPESHGQLSPTTKDVLFKYVERFTIGGEEVVNLKIPEGVNTVSDDAFNGYSGLQSVEFASSVKTIGTGSFANCKNLKTVNVIGKGIESISNSAFKECGRLTDFTWPESLVSVGDSAFKNCSSLKSANLSSLSVISKYAFCGCSSLNVKLPERCEQIGEYAFYGNTGIKTLDLFVERGIGRYAFAKCTGITQVSVGYNQIPYPNDCAFEDCTGLKSVVFQAGTRDVCQKAFSGCTALSSVEIPEGVTTIQYGAFNGCSSLTEITIPGSVVYLYDACTNCENLKSVNVKSLESWMGMETNDFSLAGGRKLMANGKLVTSVELPAEIKPWFKNYEYLESITIPAGTAAIFYDAFNGCDNISRIYCYAETPPRLSDYAFSDNCIKLATVYVPAHLVEAYKQDELNPSYVTLTRLTWAVFRIEPLPDTGQKCATPTIKYENGKLSFGCDTEGAKFVSLITNADVGSREDAEIDLTATYNISVYATAKDHINSDLVRATLCWIATEPQVEIIDDVAEVKALPVLVEYSGGMVTVRCQQDGQNVVVYSLDGVTLGSAVSKNGVASVMIGRHREMLLVKVGSQTIKIR